MPGTSRRWGVRKQLERHLGAHHPAGTREAALRVGTGLALLVLVLLVALVMGNSSRNATSTPMQQAALAALLPTATLAPTAEPIKLTPFTVNISLTGITRLAALHTILPTRPRFECLSNTKWSKATRLKALPSSSTSARVIRLRSHHSIVDRRQAPGLQFPKGAPGRRRRRRAAPS